jgi:hypothetical protein
MTTTEATADVTDDLHDELGNTLPALTVRLDHLRSLPVAELYKLLLTRLTRFTALAESQAPAVFVENERRLCREAFEILMTHGPGRAVDRDPPTTDPPTTPE